MTPAWAQVSNPLLDDAAATLEDGRGSAVVTIVAPGAPGAGATPGDVVIDVDNGQPTPRVLYRVITTDADGEDCWAWRAVTQAWLDANTGGKQLLPVDQDQVDLLIEQNGLSQCVNATVVEPIDPADFRPSLEGVGAEAVPVATFSIQPGNRPLVGQPAYLDEGLAMSWAGPVTVRFPGNSGHDPFSVEVPAQAVVTQYWVDWDWDGVASIDAEAAADASRSVTGPHTEAPRAWRDGNPGNVPWTYQFSGRHVVGVVQTWQVTATWQGQTLGPVTVTTEPGSVAVQVREAQPVGRT